MDHRTFPEIIIILTFVLVPVLIWLLKKTVGQQRLARDVPRTARVVVLICVICALVSASIGFVLVDMMASDDISLVFRAEIKTSHDTSGVLFAPVTADQDLQAALELTGEGEYAIVETEKGRAVRINFTGSVTLYGRVKDGEEAKDWSLTMLSEGPEPMAWTDLLLDSTGEDAVSLVLHVTRYHGDSSHMYLMNTNLVKDWNVYPVYEKWAS